ncbi:hypothetical protein AKO1_001791 [Acrasis kona]|uniref:Uncharacterized protein n=1 Tax=Acrasis kona TaxID=1008807 RepID=A0AAW2Z8F4_9EUKA
MKDIHEALVEISDHQSKDHVTALVHFRPGSINTEIEYTDRFIELTSLLRRLTNIWSDKCRLLAEAYEPQITIKVFLGEDQESELTRLNQQRVQKDDESDEDQYETISEQTQLQAELNKGKPSVLILAIINLSEKSRDPRNFSNERQKQTNFQQNPTSPTAVVTESQLLENYINHCNRIETTRGSS